MTAINSEHRAVTHLLRRAGFGGSAEDIAAYTALGYEGAVERLVNYEATDDSETERVVAAMRASTPPYANPQRPELGNTGLEIAVWLARMLFTARPLQEKMAFFWHCHFATSDAKLSDSAVMLRQNNLFRVNALTSDFKAMVKLVARDPAMLIFLDNYTNRKGKPNENFARELMELFTLGIGNYSEGDVKESARAFTGWTVDQNRNFRFDDRAHDGGSKQFMGVSGNLDGDDVIDIVLTQPAHATFMARKLLRFFLYENPDEATVRRFADIYAKSGYNVRETMRQLFLSPEFRSERAYLALVKSPVEFAIGAMRQLSARVYDKTAWDKVGWAMNTMGQYLYYPPDVGGWPGGRDWCTSSFYLNRSNFAANLVGMGHPTITDPWDMAQAAGVTQNMRGAVDYFVATLLGADAPEQYTLALLDFVSKYPSNRPVDGKFRGLVRLIMSTPIYQLN